MNVGELFAGIGGFSLGFERAGFRTVWQVEREPYRRAVLARHFPDAERFEDVREVGARNLERVDVVAGGFPCTDLSLAGKGAGLDGEQSGLWSEMVRVVRELRPRYVVVENVPALLGRGFGRVLGDLASSGFDAEWDCLPASAFGAPHRRDRLWLVAYSDEGGQPLGVQRDGWQVQPGLEASQRHDVDGLRAPVADTEGEPVGTGLRESEPRGFGWGRPSDRGSPDVQDADSGTVQPRRIRRGAPQASGPFGWPPEPDVGRVAHGVPARLDRLAALGDSLVPQIAEWIGRRILEAEQSKDSA